MLEFRHSSIFSRLRGLLEVTRLVRTTDDLDELLAAVARTVAESLGFRTVAINLYRREWDDFVVTTVHGSDAAREALLGQVNQHTDWERLLDARFLERGAYFVPHGEIDWTEQGAFTPDLPVSPDPGAWHPEDALLVPMRSDSGALLGILSVDEPVSGRRPSGDETDVLVAVAEHAALAVEAAQEAAQAQRHREALERLLEVSTRLTGTWQTTELLDLVCTSISDALGFGKVSVELLDRATGMYETRAAAGFASPDENIGEALSDAQLERLLQPQHDVEGCFLLAHDEARALLPERRPGYRSQTDGRGPHAWTNHWLFVPLHDARGGRVGYIWCDDPADRLVPTPERLQLVRAFANQAATALTTAAHLEALEDSNERHRSLIAASPIGIIDFDIEGRVRAWNDAAAQVYGWSADEVIGRFNPTVPEEEHDFFLRNIARVAAGETIRDLRVARRRRDGSDIDVSISAGPIRNGQGEITGIVSTMIDVSDRRRAERALQEIEGRKDAILRSALDSVITIDHDGRVVEFNPAAEEVLGWTSADATGACFVELTVSDKHREALAEALRSGKGPVLGTRFEIVARRADGREFPAEIAMNRVDVPGPPVFAVSLRDITRRRERAERLREAEAKYRTLVEQIPLATYINEIDLPLRTRYISPQVEAMLGYPVSQWLEPGFFPTILHPDDRERVLEESERVRKTGEGFRSEYRLRAADGRVVWVLDDTVVARDEEYRPLFLQGFLLDVSDRYAADGELAVAS
jgi:PAS domain S-box-containing protein